MAVNSITFGGVNSADFGIYISGEGVFNAPKRDVEMIKIPGRNGEFALDNGRFENIEVTYPAFNFEPDDYDTFMQNLSDFRNAICAQRGYQRLTDTFHPDEYRMATYIGGLEIKPVKYNTASEFNIVFDCKPQRWLTSGETAVTIGEWGETETASGDIVSVENPNGILAVNSLEVDLEPIQDLNGYDKPWSGGAGKNKLENTASTTTKNGITFTVNSDGTVTANGTATADAQLPIVLDTSKLNGDLYFVGSNGATESVANAYMWDQTTGARCKKWDGTSASATSFNGTLQQVKVVQGNTVRLTLRVMNGKTVSNHKFIPMIVASSVSDATYEPYENICPISGHDSVDTQRTGKNLANISDSENGGINANGNNVTDANNWRSTSLIPIKGGQEYTLHANGMAITRLYFYDASGTFISPRVVSQTDTVTATAPSNAVYAKWTIYKTGITSADVQSANVQLELGSTATAYEPYQGTTYTTALGRTVYGGTLDVVSGELVVDRAYVDLGSLNWTYTADAGIKFRSTTALPNVKVPATASDAPNAICSAFEVKPYAQVSGTNGRLTINFEGSYAQGQVWCNDSNYSDAQSFKTAMNGVQLVYELATPQTYQLTAQQISLLTGDNNIWSDSGDIALEYGQNPSVLFNPTLFESSPLLETAGSGTIAFNDYEIEFEGVPIGEVQIAEKAYWTMEGSAEFTFDTTLLNTGDPIYPEARELEIRTALKATSGKFIYEGIISSTNVLDASGRVRNNVSPKEFWTHLIPDLGDGFVYGTAKTITCSAIFHYQYGIGQTSYWRETVEATIAYGGADSYTVTVQSSGNKSSNVTRNDTEGITTPTMYGDSSKPNTDPIFIDCDLGEAYTNEGGVYRSLNQYIDLGSELPTLGVGANEVTFDSTITELKITPRFWKV